MAWNEFHQTIWTHRKTIALAIALDIEPDLAVAKMARLWHWSLDNAPSGDLTGLPPAVIAVGANWHGDPEAFTAAIQAAGFTEQQGDRLVLHDWDDYAGKLVEKRKANAERMRKARHGDPSGPPPPAARETNERNTYKERAEHVQGTSHARAGATVQNSTKQNSTISKEEDAVNPSAPAREASTSSSPYFGDLTVDQKADLGGIFAITAFGKLREKPASVALAEDLVRDYPDIDLVHEAKRCAANWEGRRQVIKSMMALDNWVRKPKGELRRKSPSLAIVPPLSDFEPSDVPLWDQLRPLMAQRNRAQRLPARQTCNWEFEDFEAVSFDGQVLVVHAAPEVRCQRDIWPGIIRKVAEMDLGMKIEVRWREDAHAAAG